MKTGVLLLAAILCLVQGAAAQSQLGHDIDGRAPNDHRGRSVSLSADGTRVAIGAPNNDGNGTDAGHVSIFELSGRRWIQLGQDIDGEAARDQSGYYSVSLSADGNRVAIGAHQNDGNGSAAGHVRIYELSGNTWIQLGRDIDGEAAGDRSGTSVSLSADGNRVAIGAPWNDENGTDAGHVRIYRLSGRRWIQLGQDIDGEAAGDWSGWSVSLSADGNRVAIGARYNDENRNWAGHVRIYGLSGNSWIQLGQDIDGEADGDGSGFSVSLSADGNRVAIGTPGNDGNGTLAGHVRIYELSGNTWIQLGQDIDGEAAGDQSGYSVSLSADGNRVAIGAPYNDGNGPDAGHVRIYELSGNSWVQLGQDIDGEAAGDESGRSVSLSADGNRVAIGARDNDGRGPNGNSAGHVRVYQLPGDETLTLDLTLETFIVRPGQLYALSLGFTAESGKPYRIESSSNLRDWSVEEAGITGTGDIIQRSYSFNPSARPRWFLRVVEE